MSNNWQDEFDDKIKEWESNMTDADGMQGGIDEEWSEVKQFITNLIQEIADEVEREIQTPEAPEVLKLDSHQIQFNQGLEVAREIIQGYKK